MPEFTHFDSDGQAHMVDVGDKPITQRRARAAGLITMSKTTLGMIKAGTHRKGDVFGIARIAGIMAAKKTAELIPLCHPLSLTKVSIELTAIDSPPSVRCTASVDTCGQTGVEMEALTAVQVTLLTIYDMCKAVDRGMTMENIRLLEKLGGRSGHWQREE